MNPLIEEHRDAIDALCRKFGVERLELFGSAAQGRSDPQRSDVDFLVLFKRPRAIDAADQYFGLVEGLQQLLQRKVDLVDIEAARNPYFIADALRHRVKLYAA
jgi:hypothetical protein